MIELKEKLIAFQEKELEETLLVMAQKQELTAPIKKLLYHPSFSVDVRHNAKIHRPDLAVWAKGELG